MHKCFYILIFSLLPEIVFCQNENLSEIIISIAEGLASDESDPEAITLFIERLHELSENPVSINSGDENEISRLFFLSDFQIKAIADYVKTSGLLVSIYEITGIPGFDQQTAEMMVPFITIENNVNDQPAYATWRNTLLTNLIIKPGERDSSDVGSPWRILSKYKFTAGHISGGFTIEKDPGEKTLTGKPPLPDFLSANLSYNGQGFIRRIIIGDYGARFGQGTNINTGIRTGLSLTAPGYMSGRNEIRPYTSTDENNFFRGAAAEFSLRNLGLSLFYSQNRIDGTLNSPTDSSSLFIEDFYKTGLHNTLSLMLKKDVVTETSIGVNCTYDFSFLRVGLVWSGSSFSLPVNGESGKPEDLFKFGGKSNNIYTFYYNSLVKKILLFGELSANDFRNLALVQGITLRPSDRLAINFLYRNYSPGFHSFHGKGPGNSLYPSNEQGMLGNFTFEAAKHLFISAGCDISYFPWLKYRSSSPSVARKKEIKLKYLVTEKIIFDLSYNIRSSMLNFNEDQGIANMAEISNRALKCLVKYSPDKNLILSSCINYKISIPSESKGILMLQDVAYKFRQAPITIWIRYCIFNTDNWDSRLYSYENDLLYTFNIPALSGEGTRSYVMVKWEIRDIAELRFKYGLTSYFNGNTLSENRDELRIQFRVWF
ncbi:MAG: helix-hairpin-helix domain-containing protein [Bacteroidales bacterium]|nr:helix-hairpin-helix domain-containing protein [Bacteroidales bacterium]